VIPAVVVHMTKKNVDGQPWDAGPKQEWFLTENTIRARQLSAPSEKNTHDVTVEGKKGFDKSTRRISTRKNVKEVLKTGKKRRVCAPWRP